MRVALKAWCGFLLFIFVLIPTFAHAASGDFFDDDIATNAARYEALLRGEVDPGTRSAAQWRQAGDKALPTDPRAAATAYAAAALKAPDQAQPWLSHARALASIQTTDNDERYQLNQQATSAAFIAYRRATTPQAKAQALAVLGELLARQQLWRPAIDAHKASVDLVNAGTVRAAYEALREEHGFRILDYSVDSDTTSPRMCVQLSEPLAKGRIDFAKFVRVDGKDPAAVTSETRQLCIDGFKHGQSYDVEIRAGLPSSIGESLLRPARYTVYVRDRKPGVRFSGRNYVLPRTGQQGLPVTTVNVEAVDLEIYRVGDRSLAPTLVGGDLQTEIYGYGLEELANTKGSKVWSGQMPVEKRLNEEVTTAIPVGDAVPDLKPGVYVAVAAPANPKPQEWDARAAQWFIVSDLGLAAVSGDQGVFGFVRSLSTAEPLNDVEVRLVARDNEVLATARTHDGGSVRFAPGLARGTGGSAPAVLVAQTAAGDYAFLDLTAAGFDLSDRGVAGRAAPGPLDAYVYTERGVYRPGANVYVTALLRNDQADAVPNVPLTFVFERPDGVEHQRMVAPDQGLGGRSVTLSLLPSVMTGIWRIKAYADPKGEPVGEASFLVEDFVPDRMEIVLETPQKAVAPGAAARLLLDGRYLYGAPAADLALEGDVVLRARTGLDGFPGYQFGLADEEVTAVRRPLFDLPRTDQNGKATVAAPLPPLPESTKPFQADVTLRLREPGGRAVSETSTFTVTPSSPMIGIKPQFTDGHVGEGGTAGFDVVSVSPDGKRSATKGLRWQLYKIDQRFQWYREGDVWRYEPITYSRRVVDGRLDTSTGGPAKLEVPVDYGRYRLEISTGGAQGTGPATSVLFTAGWFAADAADTPDFLDIALDKASYRPGETAKVTLTPRAPGQALVTVVKDGVLAMKAVDVTDKPATVELEVGADWGPGAYVTAMLYRPMDVADKRMPSRSVGVAWLGLDRDPREIGLSLALPEKIEPRTTLDVPVTLAGLAPGEDAYLTVAAVDVGILNLTGYEPPAPEDWYYAQRRLGVEIRDLYGRLIDGMNAQRGQLRSGGDGGGGMNMQGSPPTQPPVALYSGIVKAGPDGKARVSFDIPTFNGTLRVMAAAWSNDKLGHATGDVIVRDPVVLTGSLPRFLANGDKARLHMSIDNVDGPDGAYTLAVSADGPIEATAPAKPLTLAKGARSEVTVPIAGTGYGVATLTATLTGPGGLSLAQSYSLDVKPASPVMTRRSVQTLAAKTGTLTMTGDVFADFVPATAKATLSVAPNAAFDMPGLLLALDRYPYGCAEQTTSKALPLLYVNDVAERIGLGADAAITERVQKAIDTLLGMQSSTGGFGLWGPGDQIWLSAYVTDFWSRARERSYKVPEIAFRMALDRLQNLVTNTSQVEDGGEALAYALYVLARAGRANVGDLRYFADTSLDDFNTPLAKAQIGAALAMYGDTARAERVFAAALAEGEPADNNRREDYGSLLRDRAGLLTLVAETGVRKASIPEIAQQIASTTPTARGNSTQENAWLLLAANALQQQASKLALTLNGEAQQGSILKAYGSDDLSGAPVKVLNRGDAPVTATVTVSGAPARPEPAAEQGLLLERSYFTLDGEPRGLDRVAQNERVVVALKVTEVEPMITRLLIADHIPAGFEIENPRLGPSTTGPKLPWFTQRGDPAHLEYRDDRFVAAYELEGQEAATVTVAYVLRAVTPGAYAHPPAVAEDMYRPERFARTDTGTMEVTAAGR